MPRHLNRRDFHRSLPLAALAGGVPAFLAQTSQALAADPVGGPDRVLVLVQLAGGNDGLNTVVPYADDLYYKARPRLGIPRDKVHRLDDALGLHPELLELHQLYKDGGLAVVTNVGYPNPNRSHFKSMDVWETATPPEAIGKTGWVGRYFDGLPRRDDEALLGLRIGEQAALTLRGERAGVVTFANPALLQPRGSGALARGLAALDAVEPTGNPALDHVQQSGAATRELSRRIEAARGRGKPAVDYPPFALCQSLNLVARMIQEGLPTRVYFVTHGGFDTHAAQANRHAGLLQELGQALALFRQDLKACGLLDRTLLMTFSEFGRRVEENKQAGTDHGTANVLFLLGGKVKAGVHGVAPDLARLDEQGDLIHKTDFRAVYAGVARDWLGIDPVRVVGDRFKPLPLVVG